MTWTSILGALSLIGAQCVASAAAALPVTYQYSISHSTYGLIGTYDRTVNAVDGITHAQSRLRVAVRIFGIVVRRETATQDETWSGQRLMAFQSMTTTNGKRLDVRGEIRGAHFAVISPFGVAMAPLDVAASDPFSLVRMGAGTVVSIRTGKIDHIEVTGGEAETVIVHGAKTAVRHFHVNTPTQPDKWEVWINKDGVPLQFSTIEPRGKVDFILTSPTPPASGAGNAVALSATRPGPGGP